QSVARGGVGPKAGGWVWGGFGGEGVRDRRGGPPPVRGGSVLPLGPAQGLSTLRMGQGAAVSSRHIVMSTQAQIAISSPTASASGSRGNRTARPFKMRSAVHAAAQASTKSSGPLSLAKPRHVVRNSASYPFRSSN